MRDLEQDLSLCAKDTPGPWYKEQTGANFKGFSIEIVIADTAPCCTGNKVYATAGSSFPADDANFIAAAREAWPEAIKRALRGEEIIQAILELTKSGHEVKLVGDWDENMLKIYIDDAHSHIGIPDGSFDYLLESLYQLLVKR